jgi:hypothetical protein
MEETTNNKKHANNLKMEFQDFLGPYIKVLLWETPGLFVFGHF